MQQIKKPIMLNKFSVMLFADRKFKSHPYFVTKVFRNELEDLMKNDSTFTGNCTFRVSR